jgi:hypothetical protein
MALELGKQQEEMDVLMGNQLYGFYSSQRSNQEIQESNP